MIKMNHRIGGLFGLGLIGLGMLAGCHTGQKTCCSSEPAVVAPASPERQAATLGRLKTLEGTWVMTKSNGQPVAEAERGTITFTTTSAGSAVREVMFPGAKHEMTNMYHMDGNDVVVTHYCAMGNQPRMRCTSAAGNELVFAFDSATNVRSSDEECMGELTVRFVDNRTIEQVWTSSKGGSKMPHAVFTLERKGS